MEDPRWKVLRNWSNPSWKKYELPVDGRSGDRPDWRGREISAKEVWAGSHGWTDSMKAAGSVVGIPVEIYKDPDHKKEIQPEHDILRPEVQRGLLEDAEAGTYLFWWLGFPCGSFSPWMRRNGGTRTQENPEGEEEGPQWERDGTQMAQFAANLFFTIATRGGLPTAEHPAPDNRYPKAFDLKAWKRIFKLKGVIIVPVDMCEYGLAPSDQPETRYRKRTWLVTMVQGLQEISRRCQGGHVHAEIKGVDTITGRKHTEAAGKYAPALLKAITQAMVKEALELGAHLCKKGGGQARPPPSVSSGEERTEPGAVGPGGRAAEADDRGLLRLHADVPRGAAGGARDARGLQPASSFGAEAPRHLERRREDHRVGEGNPGAV